MVYIFCKKISQGVGASIPNQRIQLNFTYWIDNEEILLQCILANVDFPSKDKDFFDKLSVLQSYI